MNEEYECDHTYVEDGDAIETVWYMQKGKDGKERLTIDYEYCEKCGKRFCVSD